jgi:hypothetical protein
MTKEEKKEYNKKHYRANKARSVERNRKRRAALTKWFKEYKKTLKCNRCPENHSACLDFHHKDPTKKESNLSRVANHKWSRARILAEIAKCEVLCANCHRKQHWPSD